MPISTPDLPASPRPWPAPARRAGASEPVIAAAERLPSLDGLRAVAILLVVIGHGLSSLPRTPSWVGFVAQFAGNGHLGVCLFFSLSGYLITHLLLKERERRGTISLPSFYLRRVLRIFPAAYAYVAVVGILSAAGVVSVRWPELVEAAFYVWNYSFVRSDWFLSHYWSLCLEEQFYLLWPAFLALSSRSRAVSGAVAVMVAMPIVRTVSYFAWPAGRSHLLMMVHSSLDAMMYGCLAALLQHGSDSARFRSLLATLFRWRVQVGVAIYLFFVSPVVQARFHGAYYLPLGASLDAAGCTFLILWALENPRGAVGRWLNTPAMVHLGMVSYSLYIWQQLFLAPPRYALPWVGVFPLNELCALAAAEVSYWTIEQPFLRLKSRLAERARPPEWRGRLPAAAVAGLYPSSGVPDGSVAEPLR